MSLLGVGNQYQTPSQLSDALFVWNWIGFSIAVLGGFLLFSASAASYVTNPAFLVKLGLLIPVALILHIVIQRKGSLLGSDGGPAARGQSCRLAPRVALLGCRRHGRRLHPLF